MQFTLKQMSLFFIPVVNANLYFIFDWMIEQIVDFLNQPYPDQDDNVSSFKGSIATAIIVFLVLAIFTPFGLDETGARVYINALGFGLVSGVVSMIVELFFRYVIKLRRDAPDWLFWKWIISVLFLVMIIAIANYSYATYSFGNSNSNFYHMLYSTFAVAIFPIVFFGSFNLIRNLKKNQLIAAEVNYKPEHFPASANVSLPIKNSTKTFDLDPSRILFLESMQNYVIVHYLDESNQLLKETHRNTISSIEDVLNSFGVKRTHRSFLVNPDMIESISGNAQGLKLEMKFGDGVVPVSRKYIHEFKG